MNFTLNFQDPKKWKLFLLIQHFFIFLLNLIEFDNQFD